MDHLFSLLHILAAMVYLTLAFGVLVRDRSSLLNWVCAALLLCFFIWSSGYSWVHLPGSTQHQAELFENIAAVGWLFFGFFFLWFAWLYTHMPRFKGIVPVGILLFCIPLALLYGQWTSGILIDRHLPQPYGWFGIWSDSPWRFLYFVYYWSALLAGIVLIWRYKRKTNSLLVKRQSHVLNASAVVPLVLGTVSNVILPQAGIYTIPAIADVFIALWAFGLAYAVTKYRLLSLTPVIAADRIIAAMKDLLFLLDPFCRIISINPAVRYFLGYTDDHLAGKPFEALLAGSAAEKEHCTGLLKTAPLVDFETDLVKLSGDIVQVSLNSSSIPGVGIVCVAHDITLQKLRAETLHREKTKLETEVSFAGEELKKTNALLMKEIEERRVTARALEESEEQFRALFEFAPDGMYLNDLRGTFIDGNREAERITGYEKKELIGKGFFSLNLLPPSQVIKAAGLLTKSILGMPTGPDEITLNRKDGTQILVEIRTFPVKIHDKKKILGIARDISLRKKAEEETQQLKTELHHAQKMEAIGRLAGGIAHDFNNLLGGIVGYADLLRMKLARSLPSEAATAQKIVDIAQQASRLTSQLLAFSRKGKYQVQAIDLHECIENTVQILERTIDRRITVKQRVNAPSAVVMGDRSQLQNALLNLGVNARDAMPNGGTLTFETSTIELENDLTRSYPYKVEPGTFVKISVTDTGAGMDADTRARAFEPFFSTKNAGKGTGLGLASVYGTIKNHGGFIELWSEEGKGTSVILCLPVSAAPPAKKTEASASPERCTGGTILLVEDEKIVRDMACDALTLLGYKVTPSVDGAEAVSRFEMNAATFDLVLLDLTMPGMNGRDCFARLRAIDPHCRVVLTSGHALDNEINGLLKDNRVSFLQKPFDLRALAGAVESALKQ